MIYLSDSLKRIHLILRFSSQLHLEKSKRKYYKKKLLSRSASFPRDRIGSLRIIKNIPDYVFKRIFRLDKSSFATLLSKIEPLLLKDAKKVNKNKGGIITLEIILLATLRFLAGGSKWDICLSLSIGFGSFWGDSGVIWPTMQAIGKLSIFFLKPYSYLFIHYSNIHASCNEMLPNFIV
jgi:hypothetical protein